LVNTALSNIPPIKSGIAIGFYNLIINIAIPLGIAYSAKLQDLELTWFSGLSLSDTAAGQVYSSVLWVLALIAAAGTVIYFLADRSMHTREAV